MSADADFIKEKDLAEFLNSYYVFDLELIDFSKNL